MKNKFRSSLSDKTKMLLKGSIVVNTFEPNILQRFLYWTRLSKNPRYNGKRLFIAQDLKPKFRNRILLWWIRNFLIISKEEAILLGLRHLGNIYGDEINIKGCRSIWTDCKLRQYSVLELICEESMVHEKKEKEEMEKLKKLSISIGLELYVGGNYDFENGFRKGYEHEKATKIFTEENMYALADILKKSASGLENLNVMEFKARNFIESLKPVKS